eukprot:GEMP01017669.1.p1 GENE.GEMP01017669.1~~GEMP01017669.1.p1  ORF type:complete len:839 (+),score=286.36 GEMP01017669.1:165-2681(+)
MTSIVQELLGRGVNTGCECGYVCGKVNYTGTSADLNAIMQVYEAVIHGAQGSHTMSKPAGALPRAAADLSSHKLVTPSTSSPIKNSIAASFPDAVRERPSKSSSSGVGEDDGCHVGRRSAKSIMTGNEGERDTKGSDNDEDAKWSNVGGECTTKLGAFVHSFYYCARKHHAQCAKTHGWLTLCEISLEDYYYAFYDFINTVLKDCRTAAGAEKDMMGELWELKQERANILEENDGRSGEYYKLHLRVKEEIQMGEHVLQTLRAQNTTRRAHLHHKIIAANAALESQLTSKRKAREATALAARARVHASIVAAHGRARTLTLQPATAAPHSGGGSRDELDARVSELVASGCADIDRECAIEEERIERGVREFAQKQFTRTITSQDNERETRMQALRQRMDSEREHRLAALDSELKRVRSARLEELNDRLREGEAELERMTAEIKMMEETLELNKDVVARLENEARHAEELTRENAHALGREQVRLQGELQAMCEHGENEVRIEEERLKIARDTALTNMATMETRLDSLHHEAAALRAKVVELGVGSSLEGGIASDEMVIEKREELDALRVLFDTRKQHVVDHLESDFVKAVDKVTTHRQRIVALREEEHAAAERLQVTHLELQASRERKVAMMEEMKSEANEGRVVNERLQIAEEQALDASREVEALKEHIGRDRKALLVELQAYQGDIAQLTHDVHRPSDLRAELRELEPNQSSLAAKLSVAADVLAQRQLNVDNLTNAIADIAQSIRHAEDNAAGANEAVEDMTRRKDEERRRLQAQSDEELQQIRKKMEDAEREKRRLESKLVLSNSRIERMRKTQDMQRLMQKETDFAFEVSDDE